MLGHHLWKLSKDLACHEVTSHHLHFCLATGMEYHLVLDMAPHERPCQMQALYHLVFLGGCNGLLELYYVHGASITTPSSAFAL
jgi:hypothetical protein